MRRRGIGTDTAARTHRGGANERLGFGPSDGGLTFVFGAMLLVLAVVVARLVYLQVIRGPELAKKAEERRTNVQVIQARRGTIYDRNGNVLATSEECYDVYCNPKDVLDPEAQASLLAESLGGNKSEYLELFGKDSTFEYIQRLADKDKCESLSAELIKRGMSGVYFLPQTKRVYPYGKVAGQIIGMVSLNEREEYEGLTGLELYYNKQLAGKDGEMIMETGLNGIPIAGSVAKVTEPIDGDDIVLSIDVDAQACAERQVEEAVEANDATSGMCVACDPRTGEIIAACSTPYADLTQPGLITNESLNLKPVSSSYDPGSIFKVLTAAIGLNSGKVSSSKYFLVPPSILVGQDEVTDEDDRTKAEQMNLREMLRRSSNVASALIAQDSIGAQTFAEGIEKFGIGSPTGIDYPGEASGMVKPLEQYDGSSVGSMSFGQGLSIPMMQMVRAVCAIANGGTLPTPHFVRSVAGKQLEWPMGSRAISKEVATEVASMMKDVVDKGTGFSAAVDGYDVSAKTGTGEQAKNGTYVRGKYLASLIGFAPTNSPEVLLYVGLNETPYISYASAGPLFSAIMGEVIKDMGVLASPSGA